MGSSLIAAVVGVLLSIIAFQQFGLLYTQKVFDTFRSAIAIETVDGGSIENILVDNVEAVNTGNAIFIRLGIRSKVRPPGKIKRLNF